MRFNKNELGRDFIVSDLHGCYDLLMAEMEKVDFNKEADRMFSVGDLIDRGPKSEKCLMLSNEKWFHSIRGNHEQMMMDSLGTMDSNNFSHWYMNGGTWAADLDEQSLFCLFVIASDLPLWIEIETYKGLVGLVHAEPTEDWLGVKDKKNQERIIWARTKIGHEDSSEIKGIDMVYVGHTILPEPLTLGNTRYIDTGAFHTGKLTVEQI
jgi:serine/threonine protein phosphatase 1